MDDLDEPRSIGLENDTDFEDETLDYELEFEVELCPEAELEAIEDWGLKLALERDTMMSEWFDFLETIWNSSRDLEEIGLKKIIISLFDFIKDAYPHHLESITRIYLLQFEEGALNGDPDAIFELYYFASIMGELGNFSLLDRFIEIDIQNEEFGVLDDENLEADRKMLIVLDIIEKTFLMRDDNMHEKITMPYAFFRNKGEHSLRLVKFVNTMRPDALMV